MSFIDKLAFIDLIDQKVLCSLTKGKDVWYIPGGKREAGESDEVALTREVKEELSVDLVPETIKHYGTFTAQAHGKPEGVMVRMTCYMAKFKNKLVPDNEIDKIAYMAYAEKSKTSPVDHLIFDDLHQKGLLK